MRLSQYIFAAASVGDASLAPSDGDGAAVALGLTLPRALTDMEKIQSLLCWIHASGLILPKFKDVASPLLAAAAPQIPAELVQEFSSPPVSARGKNPAPAVTAVPYTTPTSRASSAQRARGSVFVVSPPPLATDDNYTATDVSDESGIMSPPVSARGSSGVSSQGWRTLVGENTKGSGPPMSMERNVPRSSSGGTASGNNTNQATATLKGLLASLSPTNADWLKSHGMETAIGHMKPLVAANLSLIVALETQLSEALYREEQLHVTVLATQAALDQEMIRGNALVAQLAAVDPEAAAAAAAAMDPTSTTAAAAADSTTAVTTTEGSPQISARGPSLTAAQVDELASTQRQLAATQDELTAAHANLTAARAEISRLAQQAQRDQQAAATALTRHQAEVDTLRAQVGLCFLCVCFLFFVGF